MFSSCWHISDKKYRPISRRHIVPFWIPKDSKIGARTTQLEPIKKCDILDLCTVHTFIRCLTLSLHVSRGSRLSEITTFDKDNRRLCGHEFTLLYALSSLCACVCLSGPIRTPASDLIRSRFIIPQRRSLGSNIGLSPSCRPARQQNT